jgi:Histidine kinase
VVPARRTEAVTPGPATGRPRDAVRCPRCGRALDGVRAALDLHDDVVQALFGTMIGLQAAEIALALDPGSTRAMLVEMGEAIAAHLRLARVRAAEAVRALAADTDGEPDPGRAVRPGLRRARPPGGAGLTYFPVQKPGAG